MRGMSAHTFIITRPVEDAGRFSAAARAAGARVIAMPVIDIHFREQVQIPDVRWQAVAITSANGARAIGRLPAAQRQAITAAQAVTVGPASSAAARMAGFARILQAAGDVAALIETVRQRLRPQDGPILYASGAITRGDLQRHLNAAGFDVHRAVLYEARPAGMLNEAARKALLNDAPGTVALYSPRSASIWAQLVQQAGLAAQAARWRHACLSSNVAHALRRHLPGCEQALTAAEPREEALLAMLGLTLEKES